MLDVDVYLDVDGVIFTQEDGMFQLRDGIIDFLDFLTKNFANCYWLTSWYGGFGDLLKKMYAGKIARKFKTILWEHNKAMFIDYKRDFIWIEDGILESEIEILEEQNCYDKYIYIEPTGQMDRLRRLKLELIERFNLKE